MKTLHTIILATVIATATLACPFACAHASLKSSNPEAGAIIATAPKEIALTFNEKIEATFSSITLSTSDSKPVTAEKARVDGAHPAVLRLRVPALGPGTYAVSWAVAGHDGHRSKGQFTFTVK